ncbi:TetR/AcrR family transcriptional regulator [Demequina iriomotensis]|uniref:TetR/AcrR family transcriptional regulator n=1 Tax=Demequina iriomotensis TaxID=1536641 RepID=UPI000781156B|nr:TetR/AcrR family transcriptional regulator [Demequina iriomotensis]
MTTTPQRRRGAALEGALLDAAWDELAERGYANLTLDAVAARAETSRPVIARRWVDKRSLVQAAIAHALSQIRANAPDTGSLREDVITLMRGVNANHARVLTALSVMIGAYYDADAISMEEVRAMLATGDPTVLDVVFARAAERGEVPSAEIDPRIKGLPIVLLREELILGMREVPDPVIVDIVDTIFMPLVVLHSARS